MNRDVMKIPVFARMFEQVHVLFWPVLWFNITRLARWVAENGAPDLLISVTWWGRITVIRTAPPERPLKPYRPLSDYIDQPTHLPAAVLTRLTVRPHAPARLNLCAELQAASAAAPAPAFDSS